MGQKLSISFEFVWLLDWFCSNIDGRKRLQAIVREAVANDFSKDTQDHAEMAGRLPEIVSRFIVLLEDAIDDALAADSAESVRDDASDRLSLREKENEEYLKVFLKNWKPSSNEPVN